MKPDKKTTKQTRTNKNKTPNNNNNKTTNKTKQSKTSQSLENLITQLCFYFRKCNMSVLVVMDTTFCRRINKWLITAVLRQG